MKRISLACLALGALAMTSSAQDMVVSRVGGSNGVSNIDMPREGVSGAYSAYSFLTTSCNNGNVVVNWNDGQRDAPVIGQNMYRIHDGRFEQLGYAWLKYSFCAVNENSCGNCQDTNCDTLGVGCADTYGSGLNDGEDGGAKYQINPTTGAQPSGTIVRASGSLPLRGRLRVLTSEISEPSAIYLIESQYVTEHDQRAGNGRNNATWHQISMASQSSPTGIGNNIIGDPGIFAWAAFDPSVTINEVVNIDEGGPNIHGYYFVGYRTENLGGGQWRYDYAVHNMTSDRAAQSFSIPVNCAGLNITQPFFRDVDGHSGEVNDSTDWTFSTAGGMATWSTQSYGQNQLANSLRWGTTYSFGFVANAAPATTQATLAMHKPGNGPASLTTALEGPCGGPICGVTQYCTSNLNSGGSPAIMLTSGSTSIASNDLSLRATSAAPDKSGIFFYGDNQVNTPFGDGRRCVAGSTFRLQPIAVTDFFGDAQKDLDYTAPPLNAGAGAVNAGDTWNFQFWFRDPMGPGGSGFNTTDAVSVTFCP